MIAIGLREHSDQGGHLGTQTLSKKREDKTINNMYTINAWVTYARCLDKQYRLLTIISLANW